MYKTPRTLIEDYLDGSKTQTVKMGRQGASQRLVRTPDAPSLSRQSVTKRRVSRTPEPYMQYSASKSIPKHDRVSSLRGKRRSLSSSIDVMETPRQLLEGFLEGGDTTAPLIRYGSRIPERGVSASQPAVSVNRRSSQYRAADSMMELDHETPRTLLQRYVTNTVDTVDTPALRRDEEMHHSPIIPLVENTYSTPSPFKASSVDSDRISELSQMNRRKTPRSERSKRGRFTMNTTSQEMSFADESVIPPTNPADYQVPSPFQSTSSDEESFVPETQPSMAAQRSFKHKGNFNITVPRELQEEIARSNRSHSRHNVENLSDRHSTGHFDGSRTGHFDGETDRLSTEGTDHHSTRHSGRHSSGHSGHSSGHSDRHSSGHSDIVYDSVDERSFTDQHEMDVDQPDTQMLPNIGEYREYTLPLKDFHDSASDGGDVNDGGDGGRDDRGDGVDGYDGGDVDDGRDAADGYDGGDVEDRYDSQDNGRRSSVGMRSLPGEGIQQFGNRSFDEEQNVNLQRIGGSKNVGRYSEGHQSRFESPDTPSEARRTRRSEGSNRQISNQMSMNDYFSPNRDNEYRIHQTEDGTPNRQSYHSLRHSSLHNASTDHISSGQQPVNSPRYYAEKLEMSSRGHQEHVHTLGNISGQFSPMISSTQRSVAMVKDDDEDHSLDAVTPSPHVSPVSSSRNNSSLTTPINNISQRSSLQDRSSSGRKSESFSSLALTKSSSVRTPLRTLTLHTQVSPQGSVRSVRSMSSNRSRSQNVTGASPIVASRRKMSDTLMTLPNNTMNFSPQVASTQNIAAISRRENLQNVSRQEVTSRQEVALQQEVTSQQEVPSQQEVTSRQEVDDDEWQDEPEVIETADSGSQSRAETSVNRKSANITQPKKKIVRKPRVKSQYSMPTNVVKKHFTHHAGMRVSPEAIETVMSVSEKYWDILAKDLEAYAKHAGRKRITMSDFALLFKRQGHTSETRSLKSLIEKYLPMEEREKLIPVARAGNRIEPKL